MINRIDDTCGSDTHTRTHMRIRARILCSDAYLLFGMQHNKRETTTPRTPSSLLYIVLPIWFLPSTCTVHISNVDNDESLMRYSLYGTDVFCFVVTVFLNENIITGTCVYAG